MSQFREASQQMKRAQFQKGIIGTMLKRFVALMLFPAVLGVSQAPVATTGGAGTTASSAASQSSSASSTSSSQLQTVGTESSRGTSQSSKGTSTAEKSQQDATSNSDKAESKDSSTKDSSSKDKSKTDKSSKDKDSEDKSSQRTDKQAVVRSDFEKFVADAAGYDLTVYGRDLFSGSSANFAPVENIPAPADYVVGPQDELEITLWGMVELHSKFVVDRNGQITIPKVGVINVAGVKYGQLNSYLNKAIGKLYKGFELNVNISKLSSIEIYVLGQVSQPGLHTVSSLSTLVNAIFASGGPTGTGSMRHIQLRRKDQVIREFDVYDLQQKGDKSQDVPLVQGDVIYFPPVGKQIAIMGNVNQPAIYELKDNTTVADAIAGAGGLTGLASTDLAILERIENHRRRQVDQFPLTAENLHRQMQDGDLLRIFPISPRFENVITLRGSVASPGRYKWHTGMHVADLIPRRDALLTRDYWNQQNHKSESAGTIQSNFDEQAANINWEYASIQRLDPHDLTTKLVPFNLGKAIDEPSSTENLELQDDDIVTIYSRQAPSQHSNYVILRGNAAKTGHYPWRAGMRITDLLPNREALITNAHWQAQNSQSGTASTDILSEIMQRNAEVNWDYALVERLDKHDLTTRLISFNLGKALDAPTSAENLLLEDGDIVTVFSRTDLPLPKDRHASFVTLSGEVNAPGVYRIKTGETLRGLVERAGGLTPNAYLFASKLTRSSTMKQQQEELDLAVEKLKRQVVMQSSLLTKAQTEQDSIVSQLSAVKATGRIVLGLKPWAVSLADIPDIPLEDEDKFQVPAQSGTIQIVGSVYDENTFRYQKGRRLGSYLQDAGGPTRAADKGRIFIIRADGTVVSRQSKHSGPGFNGLAIMPGDAIVVPQKIQHHFYNPFSSLGSSATSVLQTSTNAAMLGLLL